MRLIILYGIGGLSDVGRHAVQVAIDLNHEIAAQQAATTNVANEKKKNLLPIHDIVVLTPYPELLSETHWNSGSSPHTIDLNQITLVKVIDWADPALHAHFVAATPPTTTTTTTSTAVISCLGNRQTTLVGHNEASIAMEQLILPAMQKHNVSRLVCISSVGIAEDTPALEWFCIGRVALTCMFKTCSRPAFRDLTAMEALLRETSTTTTTTTMTLPAGVEHPHPHPNHIDYLIVRPVGIGEDIKPVGQWQIQKRKHHDKLGIDMAKLDVARFMCQEALRPTYHCTAVVLGSVHDASQAQHWDPTHLLRTCASTK